MPEFFSAEQYDAYQRDGFVMIRNLFDAEGKATRMATWNHPGDSVYGYWHHNGCLLPLMASVIVALDRSTRDNGLFFHANLMHRSDQNRSSARCWTVLFCYNAARNDPYLEHHHPRYTALTKVPDCAVKAAGSKHSSGDAGQFRKTFANPPELSNRYE